VIPGVFLSMYTRGAGAHAARSVNSLRSPEGRQFRARCLGILYPARRLLLRFSGLGAGHRILLRHGAGLIHDAGAPASLEQIIVYGWWPIAGRDRGWLGRLLGAAYPGWRAARQDPIEGAELCSEPDHRSARLAQVYRAGDVEITRCAAGT